MMRILTDLWSGRHPLPDAFWTYAIFWGFLINLAALIASLAVLVMAGGIPDAWWAGPAAVALHLLPMPYNGLALVGVWRSSARPEVGQIPRLMARCAVVAWTLAVTLV
jgi:hypothetical protein